MPFTDSEKNRMLDSSPISHVSLHSALPDQSGSNELSGGAPPYARKAGTWAAAASGQRASTAEADFDVPAGAEVQYVGFWDALSLGAFIGFAVAGGTPFAFTVDVTGDAIQAKSHGLANGEMTIFFNDTPPTPLVAGTIYYVLGATTETFQVAASEGGAAIDLTDQGADAGRCSRIVPESFGAQGTHKVTSYPISLNF